MYIFLSEEVLESDPQLALDSSDGKPFGYVSRQQFSDTRCEIRGLSQTQPSRGFELLSAELPFFVCLKLHSGGVLASMCQFRYPSECKRDAGSNVVCCFPA